MLRPGILALSLPFLLLAGSGAKDEPTTGRKEEGVHRETTPPRLTLYLPIPLGAPRVEEQSTGIFGWVRSDRPGAPATAICLRARSAARAPVAI
jgi:hypothetical protein